LIEKMKLGKVYKLLKLISKAKMLLHHFDSLVAMNLSE
jgi:hypothetical protein